jgi:phosphoribosylanthranilate isomerase
VVSYFCGVNNTPPLLKFHHVTNLTDARMAAAAGAEWIGFDFNSDHTSYVSPISAREIVGWLSGSKILGELGAQTLDEVAGLAGLVPLQAIEWSVEELLKHPHIPGLEVLGRITPERYTPAQFEMVLEELSNQVAFFVLEGEGLNAWSLYADVIRKNPVIWQAPFSAENLEEIKSVFNPAGFSISGNVEDKPGLSDTELINEKLDLLF